MKWNAQAIRDIIAIPDIPNPRDNREAAPRSERDPHGIDLGEKSGETGIRVV